MRELLNDVSNDWEKLVKSQDVDAIVNKYTEDCIYIHKKNGKTDVVVGRESELHHGVSHKTHTISLPRGGLGSQTGRGKNIKAALSPFSFLFLLCE